MGCQALIRSLDGRTLCLQLPGTLVGVADIKARLSDIEGLPVSAQRLLTGTHELDNDSFLEADVRGLLPSLVLLLRLRGGKGGFGSLLRGAHTGVGKKKNNNFDACRDMSGRRLRHVNAERELMEWQATAKDREAEKKAAAEQRKAEKQMALDAERHAAVSALRSVSEVVHVDVASAVESGLAEAQKLQEQLKRKGSPENDAKGKRLRIWGMPDGLSDAEETDEEDEDSVGEAAAGPSSDGAGPSHEGPSNSEQKSRAHPSLQGEASPAGDGDKTTGSDGGGEDEPLDLAKYESAQDLEALGSDRLKVELQKHGLKCGGSVSERAARLFLLKSTSVKELDAKHVAKPVKGKASS